MECTICKTTIDQEDVSRFATYGGLLSPCCRICVEVNDFNIKSHEELAAKSLLTRAKILLKRAEYFINKQIQAEKIGGL
jgi:hypothetical protein